MTSIFAARKYQKVEDYEEKAINQLSSCLSFLKNHPTLSFTLTYLFISCFGLIYINALLTKFSINILPHLEITDFTLAAVHYPTSIIAMSALAIFSWLAIKLELLLRKIKILNRISNKLALSYMFFSPIIFYSAVFLMAIFATNIFSANETYQKIIENKNQIYTVMLSNEIEISEHKTQQFDDVQIIADTHKYLWVYLKESKKVHAIPQKNITALLPTLSK